MDIKEWSDTKLLSELKSSANYIDELNRMRPYIPETSALGNLYWSSAMSAEQNRYDKMVAEKDARGI